MTIEQIVLVALGVIGNGLTFALGIAVGISLRKESFYDRSSNKAAQKWHQAPR